MKYTGKKLLILGGAFQHCKLVKAAQEYGAYAIVTDNLLPCDSPAKQIADEYWMISIYDVDSIVKKCQEEEIDGVISGWLDPCQRPYAEICSRLNLYSYCTPEQVLKMTDKKYFKEMCRSFNVDVIPDYKLEDVKKKRIEFPVFVKPTDSRGSRGQSVCYSYADLELALEKAKNESSDGGVIIEKYIENGREFHVTYFFLNGEPYLVRTSDNYCGTKDTHMDRVVSCAVMPSKNTALYLKTAHHNVEKMFMSLGIENGPIFMQGFEDDGVFRFFDPGIRFPGVDYELVFKKVFNIDFMKAMVDIAFSGCCDISIPNDAVFLDKKSGSVFYLSVMACHIIDILGEEKVIQNKNIIAYLPRCKKGDFIDWNYDVNQRLAEIDILTNNIEELRQTINYVQDTIVAIDENGENAIYSKFDTDRIT